MCETKTMQTHLCRFFIARTVIQLMRSATLQWHRQRRWSKKIKIKKKHRLHNGQISVNFPLRIIYIFNTYDLRARSHMHIPDLPAFCHDDAHLPFVIDFMRVDIPKRNDFLKMKIYVFRLVWMTLYRYWRWVSQLWKLKSKKKKNWWYRPASAIMHHHK